MFPSQQAVLEVERILGNYFFNAEFPQGIIDEFSSNEKFADALARTACDTYEFGNKTSGTMKTFGICSPFEAARDLITGLTARASNNRPEEEKQKTSNA